MNTTAIIYISSEITDNDLTNFKETKAKDSIPKNNSRECSPIPFRPLSLENDYTLPGTTTASPLSVPEKRVGIRVSQL